MNAVYLDNCATTALDDEAFEAMLPFLRADYGNASSVHGFGQKARAAVEDSRSQVAELIGAEPSEIVFSSGGTEADNMALRGTVRSTGEPAHIVTSEIEHPAVLRCCEALETEGHRVTYLGVDRAGVIPSMALDAALTDQTCLVSIQHANNETGVIQPIGEMVQLAHERGALFHTDAVQTVGKIPVDVGSLGVDLLSLSGHKTHGPKGVGALYVRRGVELVPLLVGGSQERKRRAGTENVPAVAGLGAACRQAGARMEETTGRIRTLRDRLEQQIVGTIAGARINGGVDRRLPHVSNISFGGLDGEALLVALDFELIAVSTGAACASGSIAPSHVLTAMGLSPERVQGGLRFSLSRYTTESEIDRVLDVLPGLVRRMTESTGVR